MFDWCKFIIILDKLYLLTYWTYISVIFSSLCKSFFSFLVYFCHAIHFDNKHWKRKRTVVLSWCEQYIFMYPISFTPPPLISSQTHTHLCSSWFTDTAELQLTFSTENLFKKVWNRMTASILKQNPNTNFFKQTFIYFNTDTQYANFQGNSLYQSTKRHLNNR